MHTKVELIVDHELNDVDFNRLIKSLVLNLYGRCKSVRTIISEPEEDDYGTQSELK